MVCPIFIDFIDNGGFLCYAVIKITLTECVLRIEVQKFTVSGMANGVRKTIKRSGSYAELHLLEGGITLTTLCARSASRGLTYSEIII